MENIEKLLAQKMLEKKTATFSCEQPYTLPSGLKSPIYTDNRRLLAYPSVRALIIKALTDVIKENFADVEVIAGVATGAVAWGTMVAEELGKPFVYVRPRARDLGREPKVEGVIERGQKVVIIEDLISSGKSSIVTADALNAAGALILGMVAIFSYNFSQTRRSFEYSNIELHTLCNYEQLLEEAVAQGILNEKDLDVLKEWSINPTTWTGIKSQEQ